MAQAKSEAGASALSLPDGLSVQGLVDIYVTMVLVRTLDERVWMMNRQGKAALVASCQGHEAAQLGSVWALRQHTADQFYFTYYRDMAVLMAQGLSALDIMLGYLAKAGEPLSDARQFPLHGASLRHRIMNLSNVVGTHVPHAVGWALACKLRGLPTVVATYFGDGATSQGDIHEAMNFASVHQLPVLFLCENNKYAISVPLSAQMRVGSVAERAAAYSMPGVTVDGTDVLAVYRATAEAAKRAASGGGPSLLEFDVERYLPHTSDDDDTVYRDKSEIEKARQRDPLKALQELLLESGLMTEAQDQEHRRAAKAEVDAATEAGEAASYPTTDDFAKHVYAPEESD
jgi:2-oxoisovalerate dehydrogenase E1 component alpha subunit